MRPTGYWLGSVLLLLSSAALAAPLDAGKDGAGTGAFDSGLDSGSSVCGNQVIDPGEACDSTNLAGKTCASVTLGQHPRGNLACSSNCQTFDVTRCVAAPTGSGGISGSAGGAQGNGGAPIGSPGGTTGTAGHGGASGSSGTSTGTAGRTAAADAGVTPPKSTEQGGCGCRVAERSTSERNRVGVGALVALGLWISRRRRAF